MNTSRRKFIQNSLKATVITSLGSSLIQNTDTFALNSTSANENNSMALQFSQVKLPYAYNALEPNIDATTMDIHYNKHHSAYVKNVNDAIAAENISFSTEKDFFANASKLSAKAKNNGGGSWNHNFFWQVMAPSTGGAPAGKVADALNGAFGTFDKFKEQFTQAASGGGGSGPNSLCCGSFGEVAGARQLLLACPRCRHDRRRRRHSNHKLRRSITSFSSRPVSASAL